MRVVVLGVVMASVLAVGCGKKDAAPAAGGGAAAPAAGEAEGPNPWKVQKETVEAFVAHVEKLGPADKAALVAGAQKFLDDKQADLKANCKVLLEYAQDLKKGEMAEGFGMNYEALVERLLAATGKDMKTLSQISPIFQTIYRCDASSK